MPAELEQEVAVLLQQLQEHCCRDGAWVENKGVLLTFHYRNVAKDKREPLVARSASFPALALTTTPQGAGVDPGGGFPDRVGSLRPGEQAPGGLGQGQGQHLYTQVREGRPAPHIIIC